MVNRSWPLDAVSGAPVYSGRALRQTQVAPFVGGATAGRPLGGRSGIRPGTSTALVTATSTVWTVGAHAGVLDVQAAAEAGPYGYAVDASVTGAVTAANASNPRVDIVYVQLADPAESDGTTTPGITVGYLAGTAAAVPVAPSAPARSLVLSQINVPKSGGGSPSVSFTAPYTVAAGGTLPVDTVTNLNLVPGWPGGHASVFADANANNNGDYRWNVTTATWQRQGAQLLASRGALRGSSAPAGTGVVIQTGNDVLSPNSGGDTTLTFPTAFPNGVLSFSANSADSSIGRFTIAVNPSGGNTAAINLHFDREASPVSAGVRITWTAIGW